LKAGISANVDTSNWLSGSQGCSRSPVKISQIDRTGKFNSENNC
jgi:hypothetical protein